MLCPNCNIVMRMAVREGVEIDYCPNCRGVWLDKGELDKLMDRAAESAGAARRPAAPPAPAPTERRRSAEEYDYDDEAIRPRYEAPRDDRRRDDDDHRRYDDDRRYEGDYQGKKRKRGFLDEIFDIFD